MMDSSRREFVKMGAATMALGARPLFAQGPTVMTRKSTQPLVISSENGSQFKNGGPRTCVEEAFLRITRGEDVLDALIAGVNIVERDPADDSVGYGGLPNAEGVVQLDSCCMHGPKKRAGGVAALEGVRTPSLVARAVMEQTDHHLIVGKGAQDFARNMGFAIEADLNTENSRRKWLEWKRRIDPEHYLDPAKRSAAAEAARRSMVADGLLDPFHVYGTINCDGVSPKGEVCGVTTTSGLSWKIPGRVGDSPILGAGLYVDGEVGAAGSTGRGEANLYNLSSYLIVENLRRGMAPKDAGMDALKRIRANTVEKRLLDDRGNPRFQLLFYVLNRAGEHAGLAMFGKMGKREARYAFCNENGPQTSACESLIPQGPPE
ncbi:MAG: asparaginase [Acidobacteria bacterium]|nr:MAG: asparaginase [Acidobacteriota bacterium]